MFFSLTYLFTALRRKFDQHFKDRKVFLYDFVQKNRTFSIKIDETFSLQNP